MNSRLLASLNATAATTKDPVVWALAVCRGASHFARHGMTPEALKAIGVVRAHYGSELHREVMAWLLLAEGVLHYFEAQHHEANERIRQAYNSAVALKTESALPICAAWMALVEFNESHYDKMICHLEEALTLAKPTDHSALARASLVLAGAYHLANEYKLARPWYDKARIRAVDDGDNATLSAVFHNVAAVRASNIRLEDSFGMDVSKEARMVSLEMASSMHYDQAIGSKGLGFLSLMLRGLTYTMEKKYLDALIVFNSIKLKQLKKGMFSSVYVDMAWCHANLSNFDETLRLEKLVNETIIYVVEPDDRAYIFSRLGQIAIACGNDILAEEMMSEANKSLSEHRIFQADLLSKLLAMRL